MALKRETFNVSKRPQPRHVHEWKDAPDWHTKPGQKAQECFPCRGLRIVPTTPSTRSSQEDEMAESGVFVHITGHDIYETLWMPQVPRKGDILWLGSLTRGGNPNKEVLVSRVEWSMEQQSGTISAWLTVRRRTPTTPST